MDKVSVAVQIISGELAENGSNGWALGSEWTESGNAMLLANHGPVVAGKSLQDAVYAAEELEETAKLYLMLQGHKTRFLTKNQVAGLRVQFPA